MKPKVLFLCTGNSARSQMEEGYLRHVAGDGFEAASAGIGPKGLNPLAIEVMREIATSPTLRLSKSIRSVALISVCLKRVPRRLFFPNNQKPRTRGASRDREPRETPYLFRAGLPISLRCSLMGIAASPFAARHRISFKSAASAASA
jgi:hypothetical protein